MADLYLSTGEIYPGVPASITNRITAIENNEFKVAYFASVSASSGTITIPTGATILLDQFAGGVDAYVSVLSSGQPTGSNPVTSGGVAVDVTSFDASGNYVLSGTPSAYPVGIIYLLKIKEIDFSNLTQANIIEYVKTTASPLTTKGDLYTFSTVNDRLSIGSNATLLMADSAASTGNKWVTLSGDISLSTAGTGTVAWANGYTTYDVRYLRLSGGTLTGALILNADATNPLGAATLQQVQSYVVGLFDDRGNFTPSGSYPSSGGSGTAGAILKGDIWTISGLGSGVSGTMGTKTVYDGDTVRALSDTPGQTNSSWEASENALGYTPITNVLNSAQVIVGNSSNVATAVTLSGDITVNNAGVTAIGAGKVTNAMLAGSIAYSKLSLTNSVVSGDIVSLAWSKITGTPTTLSGYGITDSVALTIGTLAQFAATTSAQLRGVISDELGTGALLFDGATPTSFTLTNATGLPIVAGTTGTLSPLRGGTGIDNSTNTSGSFLRSNGTNGNFAASTLILPNSATANYVPYATSTNTWGESANLTFDNTTLSVGALLTNGTVSLRSLVGTATVSAVYLTSAALSASNYALDGNSTATNVNGPTTSLSLRVADVTKMMLTVGAITFTPGATSSGVTSPFTFTTPLSTAQTAGTETIGWDFDAAANSIQHASNTGITIQRNSYWRGRAHRFVSATGTISDAFTGYWDPPSASTNAAITRAWAGGFAGRLGVLTNIMIGSLTTAATASIHTIATTTSAGTACFKSANGIRMTSAEAGTQELENDWYFTKGDFALRYGLGGTIFDHYADAGNTTTAETDIYSDTIAASRLSVNGQKLQSEYGLTFVVSATATRQVRVYFGGNLVFDTGALTISAPTLNNASLVVYLTIVRDSATTIRYNITANTNGASTATYANTGKVTGLTLSNSNVLKITGQSAGVGAATNDIVGYQSHVNYLAAA